MMRCTVTLALLVLGLAGCTSRPPTIAHVHIGHAITAVHVTPNHLPAIQRAGGDAKCA